MKCRFDDLSKIAKKFKKIYIIINDNNLLDFVWKKVKDEDIKNVGIIFGEVEIDFDADAIFLFNEKDFDLVKKFAKNVFLIVKNFNK